MQKRIKGAYGYTHKTVKSKSHANRGKALENYINESNESYLIRGQAEIIRQHPEIKVLKLNGKEIVKAFFKDKGAPDYAGLTHGRGICFDAKETGDRERFKLELIKDHQIQYLKRWQNQGGISFIILHFTKLFETYIVPYDLIASYWEQAAEGGRKSIPVHVIQQNCDRVKAGRGLTLDWLAVIEKQCKGDSN